MTLSIAGLFSIIGCVICLACGPQWTLLAMMILNLMGAASALMLGSMSIAPGIVGLSFALISLLLSGYFNRSMTLRLLNSSSGSILLIFMTYVILSGYFFPRLFEGATNVNAIGSTGMEPSLVPSPLVPSSGNISQTIYLTCSAFAFVATYCFCNSKENIYFMLRALMVCSIVNIAFAFLDIATYYSSTGFLLEIIRNGPYAMHVDESIHGLKRIAGSFTEVSTFAFVTLSFLALSIGLQGTRLYPKMINVSIIVQVVLLALSTSSTAYVGLFALFGMIANRLMVRIFRNGVDDYSFRSILASFFVIIVIAIVVLTNANLSASIIDILTTTVFEKGSSESGLERGSWNTQGMLNLIDTYGVGVGIGGARASSFVVAILSNLGLVGSTLFLLFCISAFFAGNTSLSPNDKKIVLATRLAAAMIFIAASISGTMVDLGISFYVFAGISASLKDINA